MRTDRRLTADITAFCQELKSRSNDLNWSFHLATTDADKDTWNLEMKIIEAYFGLDERLEDMQKRIKTTDELWQESLEEEEE